MQYENLKRNIKEKFILILYLKTYLCSRRCVVVASARRGGGGKESTQLRSVLRSQNNSAKEQIKKSLEIKETGTCKKNTQIIQRTSEISSIIFSPPFSNSNPCGNKEQGEEQKKKWEKNNVKGGSGFLNKIYSDDENNIGNLKYGDKIGKR